MPQGRGRPSLGPRPGVTAASSGHRGAAGKCQQGLFQRTGPAAHRRSFYRPQAERAHSQGSILGQTHGPSAQQAGLPAHGSPSPRVTGPDWSPQKAASAPAPPPRLQPGVRQETGPGVRCWRRLDNPPGTPATAGPPPAPASPSGFHTCRTGCRSRRASGTVAGGGGQRGGVSLGVSKAGAELHGRLQGSLRRHPGCVHRGNHPQWPGAGACVPAAQLQPWTAPSASHAG